MRRSIPVLIAFLLVLAGSDPAAAQLPEQVPPPGTPKAVATAQPAKPGTPPLPAHPPQPPLPPEPGQAPQPPPAPQAKAPPPPAPLPKPPGLPINVKIELTITDQLGTSAPVQKTVSLVVADRQSGMIRSEGVMPGYGGVMLNVDAEAFIVPQADGKIQARIGLAYDLIDPKASATERQSQKTQIRENLTTVLESGKPMILSQSADPVTDRKVTVEAKATIMK